MRWFRQTVCRRPSKQHLLLMVLLAGFIAALVPVPFTLTSPGQSKDRSEPFPCQDRPCACRSAAQCRKTCCCFTPQQKMAWAKRRGLNSFDVPQTLATAQSRPISSSASLKCCSMAKSTPSSAAIRKSSQPASCAATESDAPPSRSKIVLSFAAQKCQGVEQSLCGLPIFLIPPIVALNFGIAQPGERLIPAVVRMKTDSLQPPVPPPRLPLV